MSNWVDDRLNSDEIDDLESYDITNFFKGKNILISPEGSGKSTTILNKIYELYQKNVPDTPLVIYSAHTIENAIEKFNTITRTDERKYSHPMAYLPEKNDKHAVLIESDSELFRKMIRSQNQDLYKFFRKHIHNNVGYIKFEIYSYSKDTGFKRLGNSASYKRRLKYQLEDNPTSSSYNSVAMSIIYNVLNAASDKMFYHFVFKFVDTTEDLFGPISSDMEPTRTILDYRFNSDAINSAYKSEGIQYFCITPQTVRNWRGFRKDRDDKIKEVLTGEPKMIFTQNKVTETLLLTELKKRDKEAFVIYDEITPDCFMSMSVADEEKIHSILKKIVAHGKTSISVEDNLFLENFNIKNEALNTAFTESSVLNISSLKIKNFVNSVHTCSNKPYLNKRFTAFNNILILTSEKLIPSILVKSFGFKAIEWMKNYEYTDPHIHIYVTDRNSPVSITKENKKEVQEYINSAKSFECGKNSTLTIGTSYFKPDMTLESCKGRNFRDNYDKIMIFKNPDPNTRYDVLLNVINEYENIPVNKALKDNVCYYATVDSMNQVLGRLSGLRRYAWRSSAEKKEQIDICKKLFGEDTEPITEPPVYKGVVEIYIYNKDRHLKKALKEGVRYKGEFKNINERFNSIVEDKLKYEVMFDKLNSFLTLYEDAYYFGDKTAKPSTLANLHEFIYRNKMSKKEFCLKFKEYYSKQALNYVSYPNRDLAYYGYLEMWGNHRKRLTSDVLIHVNNMEFDKIDMNIEQSYPNVGYMYILGFWALAYSGTDVNAPEFNHILGSKKHHLAFMHSSRYLTTYYNGRVWDTCKKNEHVSHYKNFVLNNYEAPKNVPLYCGKIKPYNNTTQQRKLCNMIDVDINGKIASYIYNSMNNAKNGKDVITDFSFLRLKSTNVPSATSADSVTSNENEWFEERNLGILAGMNDEFIPIQNYINQPCILDNS